MKETENFKRTKHPIGLVSTFINAFIEIYNLAVSTNLIQLCDIRLS